MHVDPSDFARSATSFMPGWVPRRGGGTRCRRDGVAGDAPPSVGWKAPTPTSPIETPTRRWKPRPDRVKWVRDIRDACRHQSVAFFFKQWGGATAKAGGRLLDGQTYNEFPSAKWSPGQCAVAAGE